MQATWNALPRNVVRGVTVCVLAALLPLALATRAGAARVKTIKIADASIVEGNAGQTTVSVRLTWSGSKGGPAPSVSYATADGTAVAGTDYVAKSGTASLSNGSCRCATISIAVTGDLVAEGDETFVVSLTNPSGGAIGDPQGVVTIIDDEGPPTLVATDASVDEGAGSLGFGVVLTTASASTVTVDYTTADGSAHAGTDFAAASGSLTFAPGQTSETVSVPVVDDALAEDDEALNLTLSNWSNADVRRETATGTILDDDPDPTVSIADATVGEGDAGTTNAAFTLTLSQPSGRETAVDVATSDATAVAGSDYTATSTTVTIPAGATSAGVDVPIAGDTTHEPDETFTVTLSGEVALTIGAGTATGTIANDDPTPTLTVDAATAGESSGEATVTFRLSNPSSTDVVFDWSTADGSAIAGVDYAAASGALAIPAGSVTTTATVAVLGDALDEPAETVIVSTANVVGATGGGAGTLTITDDDPTPTALTLRVVKRRTTVRATGLLEPATSGLHVTVRLSHRVGGRWGKIGAATVIVRFLKDRDGDGALEGSYVAAFPRPAKGSYRFRVTFAGTTNLTPCRKKLAFTI
jgi:hypothetical protein